MSSEAYLVKFKNFCEYYNFAEDDRWYVLSQSIIDVTNVYNCNEEDCLYAMSQSITVSPCVYKSPTRQGYREKGRGGDNLTN